MPGEAAASEAAEMPGLLSAGVQLGGQVRSLNSVTQTASLAEQWARRGVLFGSLDQLLPSHGDQIRPYLLSKAVDAGYDKFSALHAAFLTGGAVLFVPRGVVIDEPLHIHSMMSDGGVDFGHILVVLEDGAEATVLCETSSPEETSGGLHCGAVELLVGQGANLRFVNLQDWGKRVWHFAHQKAVVQLSLIHI